MYNLDNQDLISKELYHWTTLYNPIALRSCNPGLFADHNIILRDD